MGIIYNPDGTHRAYTSIDRHWCPRSEPYTGADSLITAQRNGWQLAGLAYQQLVLLRGGRHTTLYHFELYKDDEMVLMPIISNPFVLRMIQHYHLDVHPLIEAPLNALENPQSLLF